LAYLLGSDYTSGVKGIGVISAAEIIEEFCTLRDCKTVTAAEVVEDLNRFKAWLQSPNDAEHNDSDFKKRHVSNNESRTYESESNFVFRKILRARSNWLKTFQI
jgi:5'-3' exonuclease